MFLVYSSALLYVQSMFLVVCNPTRPTNGAVVEGQTMNMSCGSILAYKVKWSFWGVNQQPDQLVVLRQGSKYDRISIFNASGSISTLRIDPVDSTDAGSYECSIHESTNNTDSFLESKFYAQLIVLASQPKCEVSNEERTGKEITVREHNTVILQCSVEFEGNLHPEMSWSTGEKETIGKNFTEVTTTQNSLTSRLSFLNIPIHFTHVYCTTSIRFANKSAFQAMNVPSYTHIWKSPKMHVMFSDSTIARSGESSSTVMAVSIASSALLVVGVATGLYCHYIGRIRPGNGPTCIKPISPENASQCSSDYYHIHENEIESPGVTTRDSEIYSQQRVTHPLPRIPDNDLMEVASSEGVNTSERRANSTYMHLIAVTKPLTIIPHANNGDVAKANDSNITTEQSK